MVRSRDRGIVRSRDRGMVAVWFQGKPYPYTKRRQVEVNQRGVTEQWSSMKTEQRED